MTMNRDEAIQQVKSLQEQKRLLRNILKASEAEVSRLIFTHGLTMEEIG